MIETHPFGSFVPLGATSLLLGSFTSKEAFDENKKGSYVWFYANGRNQFWPILKEVYGVRLETRAEMQELFRALHMGMADIIYQCERKNGSSLDTNLLNIVYAVEDITRILENNAIAEIYFSSCYVEATFRRVFKAMISRLPDIELVTLPSPSPRYARMSRDQKIKRYKDLLPQLPPDEEKLRPGK